MALAGQIAHTCKPDEDNIGKAVKDAFNGKVWVDDGQVVAGTTVKTWAKESKVSAKVVELNLYPSNIKRNPNAVCAIKL